MLLRLCIWAYYRSLREDVDFQIGCLVLSVLCQAPEDLDEPLLPALGLWKSDNRLFWTVYFSVLHSASSFLWSHVSCFVRVHWRERAARGAPMPKQFCKVTWAGQQIPNYSLLLTTLETGHWANQRDISELANVFCPNYKKTAMRLAFRQFIILFRSRLLFENQQAAY